MAGALTLMMGVTPDRVVTDVSWGDVSGVSPAANSNQTMLDFGGTLTLRHTLGTVTADAGAKSFYVIKNGSIVGGGGTLSGAALITGAYVETTIVATDTIRFGGTKGAAGSGTNWASTAGVTTIVETGQVLDAGGFTNNIDAAP